MKKTILNIALAGVMTAAFSGSALAHNEGTFVTAGGNPVKTSSGDCIMHSSGADDARGCYPAAAVETETFEPVQAVEKETFEPAPVAAPEPAPEPAPKKTRYQSNFALSGDTLFDTNSSEISSAGRAALNDFVSKVNNEEGLSVEEVTVVGHADSRGADAYNQALSERRAKAVADYLVLLGMKESKISSEGRGETDPVASNDTAEGRAQNRRVEIALDGTTVVYK